MIFLVIITLAYCSIQFQPNNEEFYSIRNVATDVYLSNMFIQPKEWDIGYKFQRDIKPTIDRININSEWVFVLQNITYDAKRVYTIYNRFDSKCITLKIHIYYEHHVSLQCCDNPGTFQYWIIEELGENRKRLKNYVEQMYLTSYKLDDLYIRDSSNKVYQQWYIELI